MGDYQSYLGIDIAKEKFDVCLIGVADGKERYRTFSNDPRGFKQLIDFLKDHGAGEVHACMEPTGRYCDKLALSLREHGYEVSIVNAYRIKGFAISELKRSKNDRIDAGVIARFCQLHNPEAWRPKEADLQELQDIGRYVDELKHDIVREKNRLQSCIETKVVVSKIEAHIHYLNEQIEVLEERMHLIIKKNARLRTAYRCATSVIGVGETLALTFLGEIGYGDQFMSARQIEFYCGLNPRERKSGKSQLGRAKLSKMGNNRMRSALYMPSLSAMQHNPFIREFAERLRAKGKHPRAIVGAVMRKLMRILFAVVKTNTPYNVEFHGCTGTV